MRKRQNAERSRSAERSEVVATAARIIHIKSSGEGRPSCPTDGRLGTAIIIMMRAFP